MDFVFQDIYLFSATWTIFMYCRTPYRQS